MTTQQMTRLNIVVRAETRASFLAAYARDFLPHGIFVRTTEPPPLQPGSRVRFRLLLSSGRLLLSGVGIVAWLASQPVRGFGLQFVDLPQAAERFCRRMQRRRREAYLHACNAALEEFNEAPTCPAVKRVPAESVDPGAVAT